MKGTIFAAVAGAILLSACASPATDNAGSNQQASTERGERTLGSLFPQKNANRPNNSITANTQEMENQRIMQAGVNPTLK